MLLEEAGDFGLLHLSRRDGEHHGGELVFRGGELDAIEIQKYEGGHGAGPLVAVQERVVLDEVEEIGGGHLEEVAVQQLAAERHLRHGDG